jgi:hypothetical protein
MTTDDRETADRWLAGELNRMWLIGERALRLLQKAQIRPAVGHPSIAETEGILAARRGARGDAPDTDEARNQAIDEAERALGALRKASPFGRIITNMELRPLEIETLVTAMAPHLDPPIADLFNLVRGPTSGRRGVDLGLVAQLFRLKRAERVALLDAIDPDRPLMEWRLIQALPAESMEAYGSLSHRSLRPTFDFLSAVCGRTELAPELTRHTTLSRHPAELDDLVLDPALRTRVEAVCTVARGGLDASTPWLVVWGLAGCGKRTLAGRIAASAGRALIAFDPLAAERGTFDDVCPRVQREALIRNALLYVGPLSPELLERNGRELVKRFRRYPGPLVIGVDGSTPPRIAADHPLWELHVPVPSEAARLTLWKRGLPDEARSATVNPTSLARGFKLTPGEIARASLEARLIAQAEGGRKVAHTDVRDGIERQLRNELGEVATRLHVKARWEDLVLPPDHMERVHEFISRMKHADTVYERWGFGRRVGYGKGLIALFSGPPGTGKTMLAGLIASSLDLDLYQVELSQVVSKWVGETEKQLRRVFDLAQRAHAVLLFDEADSLFAKRTEVNTSNDRFANMAVNYLLQQLEQYTGIAVLTTNKESALDEALQRRVTLHLHLEIPDLRERIELWKSFLPPTAPVEGAVDFELLAAEFQLSGGYIKNAAVRAAFLAASHDAAIGMELLRLASALELEDMGRVVLQRRGQPAPGNGVPPGGPTPASA